MSSITAVLYQESSALHYLLAVEPDIEIAADAVDMRFRDPLCAGVLCVRMTKCDMHSGNFFILQNMADDMSTGGVCANGKFADAATVLISAGVSAKFVAQILVLGAQRADTIVFHLDCERIGFEIAKAFAQVIADHAVNHEDAIRIHWRGKNFAARQVAPFVRCDDAAGLEPFE